MQFVLPFEFKNMDQIPLPTSSKITVRFVPEKIIAVTKFPGWYNREYCNQKFAKLKGCLLSLNILRQPTEDEIDTPVEWSGV